MDSITTFRELASAASPLLVLLSLRVAPSFVYVLFTSELSTLARIVAAAAFAPLLLATVAIFDHALLHIASGLLYYFVCVCAIHQAIPWIRARLVTPAALFGINVAVFLLFPCLLLSSSITKTFLVFGFEAIFSTYSYAIERSASTARSNLRDCLFFVFVDPTLAYIERSRRSGRPRFDGRGVARMVWGVAGLVVAVAVLVPVKRRLEPTDGLALFQTDSLFAFVVFAIVRFLLAYVQQSALASFQIGLMRQLGYSTPESFRYPLFAVSPLDFWRRWNVFLGNWIRRYLYVPLTLRIARSWRRMPLDWAKALGVTVTFTGVGLAHAGYSYVASFAVNPQWIAWFTFHGVLVVAWVATVRLFMRLGITFRGAGAGLAIRSFNRVWFLGVLSCSVAYWSVA